MAQTWKAFVQVNGEEVTIYDSVEYPVSDELYSKIQESIGEGKLLSECGFYKELKDLAENAFDLAGYLNLEEEEPAEPDREDYEDEESYQEDMEYYREELEEYQEMVGNIWDRYSLEEVSVYDPTELKSFKGKFIGRKIPGGRNGEAGKAEYRFQENGFRIVEYEVTVDYNGSGVITDLSLSASGMESDGLKSSSWGNCHPNYELLEHFLNKSISKK